MLAYWKEKYEQGEKPNKYTVKKAFNAVKKILFPFVQEVNAHAVANDASDRLGVAYKNFFSGRSKFPKFHSKKQGVGSFSLTGSEIKYDHEKQKVFIPRLGWLMLAEKIRFEYSKIYNITVSCKAGRWFVSFCLEVEPVALNENQVDNAVGIDLGISALATLSDGTVIPNLRLSNKYSDKLRMLNKQLSRRTKGGKNWWKTVFKIRQLFYKIDCIKQDYIHKFTTNVSRQFSTVALEDLNVKGMVRNRKLARHISDCSFAEIRRQFEYKANNVVIVDRFFPSSKTCSHCGFIQNMPLSKRTFECESCGVSMDRDFNAAVNLYNFAVSSTGSKKPVAYCGS